jgi:hypothetical protein
VVVVVNDSKGSSVKVVTVVTVSKAMAKGLVVEG